MVVEDDNLSGPSHSLTFAIWYYTVSLLWPPHLTNQNPMHNPQKPCLVQELFTWIPMWSQGKKKTYQGNYLEWDISMLLKQGSSTHIDYPFNILILQRELWPEPAVSDKHPSLKWKGLKCSTTLEGDSCGKSSSINRVQRRTVSNEISSSRRWLVLAGRRS